MDPGSIIAYMAQALQIIPALIQAGGKVMEFIEQTNTTVALAQKEKRSISDAEWDASNKIRDNLHSLMQAK